MKAILVRLVRFASVGSMGTVLQLALLAALTGPAGVHFLPATAVAVETAILHNFLWHERWTWGDRAREGERLRRLVRFHGTIGIVSLFGNLLFMQLFVGELSLPPLAGNVASIACCAGFNFLLNHRVVFV